MSKPVQECLNIVAEAKNKCIQLLTGTPHVNNILELNALFTRIETKLTYMGAVTEPDLATKSLEQQMFQPITNFMGEEIVVSKPINKAQLSPKQDEVLKFQNDVTALYAGIRTMEPGQVLRAHPLPEHILIVRGVAKRAGVDDFASAVWNEKFIEDIQLAIELKEEVNEAQQKIDKASGKNKPGPIGEPLVLTEEAIAADPLLQKQKAQPGDELITAADGKVTLKRKKA